MSLNNWESSREEKVSEIEEDIKKLSPKAGGIPEGDPGGYGVQSHGRGKRLVMLMLETYRMFRREVGYHSPFCGCPGDDPYLFPRT